MSGTRITLEFSKSLEKLMDGSWFNAGTAGYIARQVIRHVMGPTGIAKQNFQVGQGGWKALSPQTLKRKKDRRKFVHSGAALYAISSNPLNAKNLAWGGAEKWTGSRGRRHRRYSEKGIYGSVTQDKTGLCVIAGFAGRLAFSSSFKSARKKLAISRDFNISKLKGKDAIRAINKAVTIDETMTLLKAMSRNGQRKLKYRETGNIANFRKTEGVLKRKNYDGNLSYANVVQAGRVVGIQTSKGTYKPSQYRRRSGESVSIITSKNARQLIPLAGKDSSRMKRVISDAVEDIFKSMHNV